MSYPLTVKIRTVLKLFTEPKIISALISQRIDGLLFDEGWFESFKTLKPIDKDGNPIPWTTYSFIDFIKPRLNKDLKVFEYGSGNSTLFFAARVSNVISCEHNKVWIDELKNYIPANCKVLPADENDYEKAIDKAAGKYDIIFVDAVKRNECIRESLQYLEEDGVLILDDSERPEYKPGKDFLKNEGFKQIDFYGIAPGILFKKCTTVFYRHPNRLGI